ncbi:MAG: WYL domain-containing protein [Gammaproteobacteria bacterium]|nr:WYL domain-containing protein [Gammaproteobacteria bacterium]
MLGARMVQAWTDKGLAQAANQALNKIENSLPERLKPELKRQELLVPDFNTDTKTKTHLALLRSSTSQQQKVTFNYTREDGQHSSRTVHPLGLFYWGRTWTLVAWCELRNQFRHFRLDRMSDIEPLNTIFSTVAGQTLSDYLDSVSCQHDE